MEFLIGLCVLRKSSNKKTSLKLESLQRKPVHVLPVHAPKLLVAIRVRPSSASRWRSAKLWSGIERDLVSNKLMVAVMRTDPEDL